MSSDKELAIKLLLEDKDFVTKFSSAFSKIGQTSQQTVDSMNLSWAGFGAQLYTFDRVLKPIFKILKEGFGDLVKDEEGLQTAFTGLRSGFTDVIRATPEFRESVTLLTNQLNDLKKVLTSVETQKGIRNSLLEIEKASVLAAAGVTGLMVALEKMHERVEAIKSGTAKIDPLRGIVGGVNTSKSDELKATYDELIKKAVEVDQKQTEIRNNQSARLVEDNTARIALMQSEIDQVLGLNNMKLQSFIATTQEMQRIKEQETIHFLAQERIKWQEKLKNDSLSVKQAAQIAQIITSIDQAQANAAIAIKKAGFKVAIDIAIASADLMDAVAVASGKSSIKAAAVVIKTVTTVMDLVLTTMNPFLRILKIATTVVSAANAISQLEAAEKALDASRNQSIQAVTNVQGLSTGTPSVTQGGFFDVGENGRERVFLPRGSAVIPNAGFGGSSDMKIEVNFYGNINASSKEDVQSMAKMVSEYISNEARRL